MCSMKLSPFGNDSLFLRRVERRVDSVHDPAEEPPVQCLGNAISAIHGLLYGVGTNDRLPCELEQAQAMQVTHQGKK